MKLSDAKLNSYTGWYKNSRDGSGMELVVKDGELVTYNNVKLLPQSETRFGLNSNFVEMNGPIGFRLIVPRADTISYIKAAPALAPNNYKTYLGRYFSEEINSFLTVSQRDGMLKISIKPNEELELTPTYKDGFTIPSNGTVVYFAKQKKGKVALKLSVPRARNVEFVKI